MLIIVILIVAVVLVVIAVIVLRRKRKNLDDCSFQVFFQKKDTNAWTFVFAISLKEHCVVRIIIVHCKLLHYYMHAFHRQWRNTTRIRWIRNI